MKNINLSKTGEKCPQSGLWMALKDSNSTIIPRLGDSMPSFNGRSINWQFKDSTKQN